MKFVLASAMVIIMMSSISCYDDLSNVVSPLGRNFGRRFGGLSSPLEYNNQNPSDLVKQPVNKFDGSYVPSNYGQDSSDLIKQLTNEFRGSQSPSGNSNGRGNSGSGLLGRILGSGGSQSSSGNSNGRGNSGSGLFGQILGSGGSQSSSSSITDPFKQVPHFLNQIIKIAIQDADRILDGPGSLPDEVQKIVRNLAETLRDADDILDQGISRTFDQTVSFFYDILSTAVLDIIKLINSGISVAQLFPNTVSAFGNFFQFFNPSTLVNLANVLGMM